MNENSKLPVIYPGSTERTSFAEKLEDKGFFEIILITSNAGDWKISEIRFITLPTRPMVDLYIDSSVDPHSLESFLKSRISEIHPDAIVRLKCDTTLNNLVRAKLTGRFVREIIPKTMNVEFGSDFRRYRNGT